MKNICKKAVVLLVALLFLSTSIVVTAKTIDKKIKNNRSTLGASIDVEKYVYDSKTGMWVDADTLETGLELFINTEASFKIVIYNDGDVELRNIGVHDVMHDSLEFISADPVQDDYSYDPPFHNILWVFPGPLLPTEIIELYVTANILGPENSHDYNYVEVIATGGGTNVIDEDYAYVTAVKKSRERQLQFLTIFDQFIEDYPNLSLIVKLLINK